ncbi:hypothetical protein ACFXPM_35695 [Streptomyces sp. NPDC059095]|uniref:hypothetical protein n=1 Tax=unclassified Streptomyces TaxID=2593676 RepID=UPI0035DA96A3
MAVTAFAQRGAGLGDADQKPEFLECDALDLLGSRGAPLAASGMREFGGPQGQ